MMEKFPSTTQLYIKRFFLQLYYYTMRYSFAYKLKIFYLKTYPQVIKPIPTRYQSKQIKISSQKLWQMFVGGSWSAIINISDKGSSVPSDLFRPLWYVTGVESVKYRSSIWWLSLALWQKGWYLGVRFYFTLGFFGGLAYVDIHMSCIMLAFVFAFRSFCGLCLLCDFCWRDFIFKCCFVIVL